jgi:hypothetical protein
VRVVMPERQLSSLVDLDYSGLSDTLHCQRCRPRLAFRICEANPTRGVVEQNMTRNLLSPPEQHGEERRVDCFIWLTGRLRLGAKRTIR